MRKNILAAVLSLTGLFVTDGKADLDVAYREIFPNDKGADTSLAKAAWKVCSGNAALVYVGPNAVVSGQKGSPVMLEAVNSFPVTEEVAAGYLYDNIVSDEPQLIWTDEVDVDLGPKKDMEISWHQSSDATNPIHLAVLVDGAWYVSAEAFTQDARYARKSLNVADAKWLALNFVENSTLVLGGAIPLTGSRLKGIGFYIPELTGKLRLDTVEVRQLGEGQPSRRAENGISTDPKVLLQGFVPPPVDFHPGEKYGSEARKYQGIPTIERAPNGRLWAVWYAGAVWEDQYNFIVAATSGDNGRTWSDICFVIDPDGDGPRRVADPCLWLDPDGKLWLFWWLNSKDMSVTMAMTTENPDAEHPVWSEPRALFSGVSLNKPIVTSNGEWLLPAATWYQDQGCRVMVSTDKGKTWELRGSANVPTDQRNADEPMMVQRKDGSLFMLVRTKAGIGESVSTDAGRSWTEVKDYSKQTASRFFLGRLKSGRLLLIRHGGMDQDVGRSHLTAFLSEDDGVTWKGGLVLDERTNVSYPDATQGPDETIYAIYDWERGRDKNILVSTFTEDDILAGKFVSATASSKMLVNKATGINPKVVEGEKKKTLPRKNDSGVSLLTEPRAEIDAVSGEIRPLEIGATIFNNREYAFTDKVPEVLHGRRFFFGKMETTQAVCRKPGIVHVLAPAPDRNKQSAANTLTEQGFSLADVPEFVLFLTKDGKSTMANSCCVYQKEVKAGEEIGFGHWGVLVF